MEQQAQNDFMAFTAPDPVTAEAMKKEREKNAKQEGVRKDQLRPEQIRQAEKLAESMKADREAEEKTQLLQQLSDYVKFMKEYHPERVEFIRAPKNFGVKNTCEELRVWIKDIQNELGKKGGIDTVKMIWVEGFKFFEAANKDQRFGLNVAGIGNHAQNSVLSRQLADGSIIVGPAVPTLAEFCVKHANWFATDVDTRLVVMAVELIAGVHRMNTQQDINVAKAAATPVSKETQEDINKL
jgi:hypothetical protein